MQDENGGSQMSLSDDSILFVWLPPMEQIKETPRQLEQCETMERPYKCNRSFYCIHELNCSYCSYLRNTASVLDVFYFLEILAACKYDTRASLLDNGRVHNLWVLTFRM